MCDGIIYRKMSDKKEKKWWQRVLMALAVVVILGLVGFLVYRFNFVKEDITNDTVSKYLVCNGTGVGKYVLLGDDKNANFEARVIFLDDKIYRVNFVVSKRFSNEESTSIFTNKLSAAYNDYMGEHDISKKSIINTVTNVDNVGKMVISIEGGKFTDEMAPLVMLDSTMTQSGADEVQEYYEKNGFTCSVDEQDMVLSE